MLGLLNNSSVKNIFDFYHSHKKQKDSLEGSLDRALFAAELEFSKILQPRLPQHTLNVNIEHTAKLEWSKQLYSLYLARFFEHWYILSYYYDINLFVIDDSWCKLCYIYLLLCESDSRSITIPELNTGGKYYCSYYSRKDDGWQKKKIKNQSLCTCRLFLLT